MPCGLPSIAARCSRLTSAGSDTKSSAPAPPPASASSTIRGWRARPPSGPAAEFAGSWK